MDDNNVFVRWDDSSHCRGRHNWELSLDLGEEDLASYSFDPFFFEENDDSSVYDQGGAVRFRATNPEGAELYLDGNTPVLP